MLYVLFTTLSAQETDGLSFLSKLCCFYLGFSSPFLKRTSAEKEKVPIFTARPLGVTHALPKPFDTTIFIRIKIGSRISFSLMNEISPFYPRRVLIFTFLRVYFPLFCGESNRTPANIHHLTLGRKTNIWKGLVWT